jgi:8-oxo-dGTP pyrophosphatase MutT (NUDIX family)
MSEPILNTPWVPHVVVAAIVQRDSRFLLVEEETGEGLRLNQPAGHWERGETLIEAVRREALEETAHHVEPTALLGAYTTHYLRRDITYLRFAYLCDVTAFDAERSLDSGIVRALWLTPEELAAHPTPHRSPLVLRCVQDCLAGRRFPLDFVHHA